MRPKLEEEDSEITKMSIPMLNYYQDAEAHIDKLEQKMKDYMKCNRCGDYFNMGDLSRVMAHEECPVMKINYESKKVE